MLLSLRELEYSNERLVHSRFHRERKISKIIFANATLRLNCYNNFGDINFLIIKRPTMKSFSFEKFLIEFKVEVCILNSASVEERKYNRIIL